MHLKIKLVCLSTLHFLSFVASGFSQENSIAATEFMFANQPSFQTLVNEEPLWNTTLKQQFNTIHVKIFPHHSKYNAPHGMDKDWSNIQFVSNSSCILYQAETSSSQDGITRNHPIAEARNFSFSAEDFSGPYWLDCERSATLVRSGNKKISYDGLFFIKKVYTKKNIPYLTVVNIIPFEEYLKGVVPSEMPASWSAEALKAQAVAARTYAYYELAANIANQDENITQENSGAQLDDTVTYQAYTGLNNNTAATNNAIELTRGELMLYNGKVIKAFFHADSGGHTEDAKNVWGVDYPYIIGKKEIYPEGSIPGSKWNLTTTVEKIQKKLYDNFLIGENETILSLSIKREHLLPSTRPMWIMVNFLDGREKRILATDFSYIFNLKSPWIRFTNESFMGRTIQIEGRGFGHGAGMNQWGARVLVDKLKMTYNEVLHFYYTDIEITK